MIHSLAIKNFYSFQDPTVIDFTIGKKAGDRDVFLPSKACSLSLNKVTGVFGANASGKTNLIKAISFIQYFILHSASEKPGTEINLEPFLFTQDAKEQPVEFQLDFEHADRLYRYQLTLTTTRVLHESLHRKDLRYRYLFERDWDEELGCYVLKSQDIGSSKQIALRENASFLASALLQKHEFSTDLCHYFEGLYTNIHMHGRMPTHDPDAANLIRASFHYKQDETLLRAAESELIQADLGITGLELNDAKFLTPEGKEETIPFPVVQHQVGGLSYMRPLLHESRGTQALYILLRYILPVLKTGGIAVIDEFETGLHSHMVKAIVEMFYSKQSNPHGAQLIANFHTDYLLHQTFEKYQIVLCEKNPDTLSTEAWRLDKIKGVARNANNHYAKYHAGAYGGVPSL